MICRGLAFLAVLAPRPHLPLTSCLSFSVFLCLPWPVELTDGRGRGKDPNHTTARKPALLYIIQSFITLWGRGKSGNDLTRGGGKKGRK